MNGILTLAIPSKGRLMEATAELLARSGFTIDRMGAERGYRGRLVGLDGVEIAFLSASEIAQNLRDGKSIWASPARTCCMRRWRPMTRPSKSC